MALFVYLFFYCLFIPIMILTQSAQATYCCYGYLLGKGDFLFVSVCLHPGKINYMNSY